jgi:hypothetical protein
MPNRPAERVVGYNYNYPSAPYLRTQIDYSDLNRILLERQQVNLSRDSQDFLNNVFNQVVENNNLTTTGNTLNTIEFDEEDDEEYDPDEDKPTDKTPRFTMTPEKQKEELTGLLDEEQELVQKEIKTAKEEAKLKKIREEIAELEKYKSPPKLKRTGTGTSVETGDTGATGGTGGISSITGGTKSSVFTQVGVPTPRTQIEDTKQEEDKKRAEQQE